MSDLLPCRFCGVEPELAHRMGVMDYLYTMDHQCLGPYRPSEADAITEWSAATAPADPALLALEAIDLPRYRSVLPMAHHDQARADAERALARFGAYVVRDWFRRTSGFQAADGYQLDAGARVFRHGGNLPAKGPSAGGVPREQAHRANGRERWAGGNADCVWL